MTKHTGDPYRTISLTGRAPVRIIEADWTTIAQSNGRDEHGTYSLRVRRHADGRMIVHGVYLPRDPEQAHIYGWRGGQIVFDQATLAGVIEEVGQDGDLPTACIDECISSLPKEDL